MRTDLRQEIPPDKIDLVRKGFWKVVNEDGGTGGRARLKDWVVAGKTGTAQASDRGHEENVAWFACFAPFDHPKYVVVVMVQGASGHGGEVAGPIATRILERTLAEDDGKFDMQVAWLAPAHHANPLQLIKAVSYPGKEGNLGADDEEGADQSQAATVEMASSNASPDVEPEADSQGQVRRRGALLWRALFPSPRRNLATFSNDFLESAGNRRPRPTPARRRGVTMNFRSKMLSQNVPAIPLVIAQPLQFYDRQGKKNFGASLPQNGEQARTQCRKARVARSVAREWPPRGIQRRA